MDTTSAVDYVSQCNQQTDLYGDSLKNENLVVICSMDNDVLECYDYDELVGIFNKQDVLTYWSGFAKGVYNERTQNWEGSRGGKPDPNRPIYRLTYTGVWLDDSIYDTIVKDGEKTVLVYKKYKHQTGSAFGMSATHGEVETIYGCIPIAREKVFDLAEVKRNLREVLPEPMNADYFESFIRFARTERARTSRLAPTGGRIEPEAIVEENQEMDEALAERIARIERERQEDESEEEPESNYTRRIRKLREIFSNDSTRSQHNYDVAKIREREGRIDELFSRSSDQRSQADVTFAVAKLNQSKQRYIEHWDIEYFSQDVNEVMRWYESGGRL